MFEYEESSMIFSLAILACHARAVNWTHALVFLISRVRVRIPILILVSCMGRKMILPVCCVKDVEAVNAFPCIVEQIATKNV